MKRSTGGLLLFAVILFIGFKVGSHILMATFFGTLELAGLIAIVESMPLLKKLLSRTSKVFDIIIFGFTILATMQYGLTVAASLTVAGLGYTLFYGPHLREQYQSKKAKPVGNYRSKFNAK
jgi:hypothetical protein